MAGRPLAASTTARTQSVLPGRVGQPFPGHAPGLLQGAAFRLLSNSVYKVTAALIPLYWHSGPFQIALVGNESTRYPKY